MASTPEDAETRPFNARASIWERILPHCSSESTYAVAASATAGVFLTSLATISDIWAPTPVQYSMRSRFNSTALGSVRGIVGADDFDGAAVAGAILLDDNDAIVRLLTRSNARPNES